MESALRGKHLFTFASATKLSPRRSPPGFFDEGAVVGSSPTMIEDDYALLPAAAHEPESKRCCELQDPKLFLAKNLWRMTSRNLA